MPTLAEALRRPCELIPLEDPNERAILHREQEARGNQLWEYNAVHYSLGYVVPGSHGTGTEAEQANSSPNATALSGTTNGTGVSNGTTPQATPPGDRSVPGLTVLVTSLGVVAAAFSLRRR